MSLWPIIKEYVATGSFFFEMQQLEMIQMSPKWQ